MKRHAQGFTLIEMMIVVVIVAIITAIALPSYQDSVRKANRADAMDAMLDTAQRLERCYTSFGAYNNASCSVPGSVNSKKAHYSVAVTTTASTYTLTATPVSAQQLKDTRCATFTLTNTGLRSATGTDSANCW